MDNTTEKATLLLDKDAFWSAKPFPHLVIDDFFPEETVENILRDFPLKAELPWTPYRHFNESKYGCNRYELFPNSIKKIIDFLHSDAFCDGLASMLGIEKLHPDQSLIGGGLHQTFRHGFLNLHTDFSHHPHNKKWKRKLNFILYLNKDWPPHYGGNLELWNRAQKSCEKAIPPLFNRAVVFLTDTDSLHGSPHKLMCRKDESRKSIALFYYEECKDDLPIKATSYTSHSTKFWHKGIVEVENFLLKLFLRIRFLFKIKH